MPDETKFSVGSTGSQDPLFRGEPRDKSFQGWTVAIAAAVVLIGLGVLLVVGRHRAAPGEGAAYAPNLVLSSPQVSQSESLSGGRSTYVDAHVTNRGDKTVTGVTVEAQFAGGEQPQTLTAPLSVIRTRQPYVDTEPLSTAPLAPGGQADVRLIFEGVSDSWDQQTPALRIVDVSTK